MFYSLQGELQYCRISNNVERMATWLWVMSIHRYFGKNGCYGTFISHCCPSKHFGIEIKGCNRLIWYGLCTVYTQQEPLQSITWTIHGSWWIRMVNFVQESMKHIPLIFSPCHMAGSPVNSFSQPICFFPACMRLRCRIFTGHKHSDLVTKCQKTHRLG